MKAKEELRAELDNTDRRTRALLDDLSEEQLELREAVRDFARNEIAPQAARADVRPTAPPLAEQRGEGGRRQHVLRAARRGAAAAVGHG